MNPHFHDANLKTLPDDVVQALVRLVLPMPIQEWTPLPTELTRTARRIDNAFICLIGAIRLIIHLEYQRRPDKTMPRRMYEYAFDLQQAAFQATGAYLPVQSIVVWLGPGQTPAPCHLEIYDGDILALHQYREIHLHQLEWKAGLDPLLLVLAPYFASAKRDDLVEIGTRLYNQTPAGEREDLLWAFLALSERTYKNIEEIKQEILRKVHAMIDDIYEAMVESSFGVAVREKALKQGEIAALIKAFGVLWQQNYQAALPDDIAATLRAKTEARLLELIALIAQRPDEAALRQALDA